MSVQAGNHTLGPANGSLQVKTYREGMASKVGHDLIIEVTQWEATVSIGEGTGSVQLNADSRSLEVREGVGGVKPLTDKDRAEIKKNIDEKVLKGQPITFASSRVEASGGTLAVSGDLTIGGATRPISAQLAVGPDGRATGTVPITQSEFGIKPYRGLMGALKVRDDVEVVVDVRLPSS